MTAQIHGVPVVNAYYNQEARVVRAFCGWYDEKTKNSCGWHAFNFDQRPDALVDTVWPCPRGEKVILRVWPNGDEWHRYEFDRTSNRGYANYQAQKLMSTKRRRAR